MNRQVDIASLVFFRVCFGLLAAVEAVGLWVYYHFTLDLFNTQDYHIPYIGFEWVTPLPDPWISLAFLITTLGGVGVLLGYRYRLSAVLSFLGHTYFFLLDKTHYLNHGYLLCWLCFVVIFMPLHRAYSLDVLAQRVKPVQKVALAYLFVPAFLMGVVYFFGGIAKVNSDWLQGIPLSTWVGYQSDQPILGAVWGYKWTGVVLAWGGMLFDLLAVPFLLWSKSRKWVLVLAILFHITNGILFSIGVFPFLSVALTALFFNPHWPRVWAQKKAVKWKFIQQWANKFRSKQTAAPLKISLLGKWALVLLVVLHMVLPLRHHWFKGDVAWNEEGHKYAWRMMLRSKRGHGIFIAENKATGQRTHYKPIDLVSKSAAHEVYGHPDMIWQLAQRIKFLHAQKGEEVKVFAYQNASLNFGPYHPMVSTQQDLASVPWRHFKHSDWILEE